MGVHCWESELVKHADVPWSILQQVDANNIELNVLIAAWVDHKNMVPSENCRKQNNTIACK